MSDLTERLRAVDHMNIEDCFLQSPLFAHAADEIDRLRLALSETEDNTLLGYIADIRQKSGVGMKPMLSELADAIAAALATAHADGMEEAARIVQKALSEGSEIPPKAVPYITGIMAAIRQAKENAR